jgi:hypothetical protein
MSENKDQVKEQGDTVGINRDASQPEVIEAEVELKPGVRPDGVSAVVLLDGKPKVIRKLKAKGFYEAQKAFANIYGNLSAMISNDDIRTIAEKAEAEGKDPSNLKPEDLTPEELDKVAKISSSKHLQNILSEAPQQLAKFVAICCEMTEDELLDSAYPDEISDAFPICYQLNNVLENIKKFGAPMQVIGK